MVCLYACATCYILYYYIRVYQYTSMYAICTRLNCKYILHLLYYMWSSIVLYKSWKYSPYYALI